MSPLNEHIRKVLAPFAGKRFLVACSGGLDSVVLAALAVQNQVEIELAHVNYGLRANASDEDEALVRSFGEKHGLKVHVKKVNPDALKANLQSRAREIRYQWFEEILQSQNLDYILLAHHRDDQVETFYLNLSRSAGLMGLSCMPFQRGKVLRPLLDLDKEDLRQFALTNRIQWREDASNSSLKYARNKVRQEFLPLLSKQIPELKESVLLLIRHFQETQHNLELKIAEVALEWQQNRKLEVEKWLALDDHEKVELLRQLGQAASLSRHMDQLAEAIKGSSLPLAPSTESPFTSVAMEGSFFRLIVLEETQESKNLRIEKVQQLPSEFSKDSIYLNETKIKGTLRLRTWQEGDRIATLGMQGTQLISEIISDARVPFDQKDKVLVVHDDEDIHWCCGLKIGRKALASKDQREGILRCTIEQETIPELGDQ